MDRHYLAPLFNPASIVAFAGDPDVAIDAAPTPEARALRHALAVLPQGVLLRWLDIGTIGTLGDLAASRVDLAVIALPADRVAAALEVACRIRVRAAMVLTSGLLAPQCAELQKTAEHYGVHLLGPNTLGVQRPGLKLNLSTLGPLAAAGPLALVSQSGALTAAMLDWAQHHGVGFSAVVSLGPNTAVELPQVLDFLAADAGTQSILVYMEGIRDARRFMSALRVAAYSKPVVVMKAGRQAAGSKVAMTHSAAIVGSDDVFEAALRRAGVVRVRQFTQLFSAAQCLASRFRPAGEKLAIVTNGGGPAVLAADWADMLGLQIARVDDLGEHASPDAYVQAMQSAVADRGVDGVLLIHSPKASGGDAIATAAPANAAGDGPVADPPLGERDAAASRGAAAVAAAVGRVFSPTAKPVIGCWMGEASARPARDHLAALHMPVFRTPEAAVDAFNSIASYYRNQQLLQQTPPTMSEGAAPDAEGARLLIEGVLAERRQVLTEIESKALLAAFHIPVTRTMLARSANEAMLIASQLGYPVALKIDSPDISHKSDLIGDMSGEVLGDASGVVLDVQSAAQVRDRYQELMQRVARARPDARINGISVQPMAERGREVYIGVSSDDPFGPVISFGAGGTMIELIADRSIELPPLNAFLARRLIARSRAAEMLREWRGAPAIDTGRLERVLLRVSEMLCLLPQLQQMDINPLIVGPRGVVAVDARIVVEERGSLRDGENRLAILPYPHGQEREWQLKGGDRVTVRPIHPDDAEMLQTLVRNLSAETRYFRFASAMAELPLRMLARFTLIDYDREMALVAVAGASHADANANTNADAPAGATQPKPPMTSGTGGSGGAPPRIVGVSRIITNPDGRSCEFSLLVADDQAGRGLGSRLMLSIIDVARNKGLSEIMGLVLSNNAAMLRLMNSLGFSVARYAEDPEFRIVTKAL